MDDTGLFGAELLLLLCTLAAVIGLAGQYAPMEAARRYNKVWPLIMVSGILGVGAADAAIFVISRSILDDQQTEIAALHRRAAEMELEATRLKQPRSITAQQHAALTQCLGPAPKGTVIMEPKAFDQEPEQFSAQIQNVLKETGFTVQVADQPTLGWNQPGVFIMVKDPDHPPPQAGSVQKCFGDVGITMPGNVSDKVPDGAIVIGVSTKF